MSKKLQKLKSQYLVDDKKADELESKIQQTVSSSDLLKKSINIEKSEKNELPAIDLSFPEFKSGKTVLIENELYRNLKYLSLKTDESIKSIVNRIIHNFIKENNIEF